jgi:hypothetical protein
LEGNQLASGLSPTPLSHIGVRTYSEDGETKYLVHFRQATGEGDINPVDLYCATKKAPR